jgi:hypothetical protein
MNRKITLLLLILVLCLFVSACGFVGSPGPQTFEYPGFWLGLWHGLIAPWTLLARFFLKIGMYEIPNSGFGYDCGFLIGVGFSIPIGWLAALIAVGVHLLF